MSGDIDGNGNAAFGATALDLAEHPTGNAAFGSSAYGAAHGYPFFNVMIGGAVWGRTSDADSGMVAIGGLNNYNNLDSGKNSIQIGYNQQPTYSFYVLNSIEIGANITLGNNKGSLNDVTDVGTGVYEWIDHWGNFGTRTEAIMIGDSGVQHYSQLASLPQCGSCQVWVQDSAQYFVYSPIAGKYVGIVTSNNVPGYGGVGAVE